MVRRVASGRAVHQDSVVEVKDLMPLKLRPSGLSSAIDKDRRGRFARLLEEVI
jgi:hypothetical protein